jgi:predicted nucleic acid-binding protein
VRTWLVDTGPLVAYLDRSDPSHGRVVSVWNGYSGRLVTTSAVVTEAMQALEPSASGPALLAELVVRSAMEVRDLCQPRSLGKAAQLMAKYANVPMDFADATLVLLGTELGVKQILTLDRRGFTVFRMNSKPFDLPL